MREETITTKIYCFEELSDDAKEKARDWFRGCIDLSDFEAPVETMKEVCKLIGVELKTDSYGHRPHLFWSGFASQGDGACFEGSYSYKRYSVPAITYEYPHEDELQRIAKELKEVQSRFFYRLTATVVHSGHYQHSGCTQIDVYDGSGRDVDADTYDTIVKLLRDLMDWFYKSLDENNDHVNSDEYVDDSITCNEYEFFESGERTY